MANIIKRVWNQNRMVQIEDLKGMTFQAEQAGHTFQISGIDDDGNTVALTGTPSGVLLRPDNTDVALTCSVSGGVVSATLPANCYDVPGRFGLTIFITSGSSKTAIYAAVGTVTRTSSGTVAPGTSQSVVDLINAINAAVNSIPASYSALLADIAPTYSDSALYSVGQYAWYDGDLKRCIVPITTAESYTAAHWTSAVLGQDVSDLKSALFEFSEELDFINSGLFQRGTIYQGKAVTTDPYSYNRVCMTEYIVIPYRCSISVSSGYKYLMQVVSSTGTVVDEYGQNTFTTGFVDTPYTLTAGDKIRFVIRKSTETVGELANIQEFVSALSVPSRIDDIQTQINTNKDYSIKPIGSNVTESNYSTALPDLDAAPLNTVINLVFANGSTTIPAHYPFSAFRGTVNTLLTLSKVGTTGTIKSQILFANNVFLTRYADNTDTYTAWTTGYDTLPEWIPKANTSLIQSSNYSSALSDCNNAEMFKLYTLNFAVGSTSIPAHCPYDSFNDEMPMLFTYGTYSVRVQIWIGRNTIYRRYGINSGATWFAWKIVGNPIDKNRKYVVDKNGNGDYTSFLDCVREALKYEDSTVYVNAGDYDLVQEYGTDWLEANDSDEGLRLGNGIHIIFSSNAKLTFNYTGSNEYILEMFSPFNAMKDPNKYIDFTLENMTLEASRCRYGIHDELGSNAPRATHNYLNCSIDFDNRQNDAWAGQCIGGGLGPQTEIIIKNCYFKCQNNWTNGPAVSWHNARVETGVSIQDARSRIVIDACYFDAPAGSKKGTFRFGWYGYSQKVTDVMITNCSLSIEPFFVQETSDGSSPYENARFIMWNNEIRTE